MTGNFSSAKKPEIVNLSAKTSKRVVVDDYGFPDLGSKNGLQFLDFHEISVGVKKNFFYLENFDKKFFFCIGRLRSTGFHDFRFSTRFGGRLCFL